jgi:hypothetical protein
MKKHLLLPIIYAAIFAIVFYRAPLLYAQFAVGIFLGFSLLFFDRILHIFFVDPQSEFSQLAREQWRARNVRGFLQLMFQSSAFQEKLVTRSILFLISYAALAIFVLTSTGSVLGAGLVLGIGLHFCLDFFIYRKDVRQFRKHFLWQIKRELSEQEISTLLWSFVTFFILLSLLVLK